jgi:hypothetical protein
MAVTSLAMAAAAAFATAVAGQLGGDVVAGFKSLVHRRFSGDRQAEAALAAVEWNPADLEARQLLTQWLAYYAAHDSDFRHGLGEVVNIMEYHIDQSHGANWRVGGPNYGNINTPVIDNRVQSGNYNAGRDVWVDQSRRSVDPKDAMRVVTRIAIIGITFVLGSWVLIIIAVVGYDLITGKPIGW